jgi:hypothetical protein
MGQLEKIAGQPGQAHTIGQLTALIKTRLRQMQDRPGLLDGYLVGTGLSSRLRDRI